MGIEPNNEGSGSVRFGRCYSSGSVRVRLILGSKKCFRMGFEFCVFGSGSVRFPLYTIAI